MKFISQILKSKIVMLRLKMLVLNIKTTEEKAINNVDLQMKQQVTALVGQVNWKKYNNKFVAWFYDPRR